MIRPDLDTRARIQESQRQELRGPSGRLYGLLDLATLQIEVKRKGEPPELIDLRPYLQRILLGEEDPPTISPL